MNIWLQPAAVMQRFAANEYIAACNDLNSVYLFDCNAGESGKRYDVVDEAGNILTKDTVVSTRYYHPCHAKHEAPHKDDFVKGRLYESNGSDRRIPSSVSHEVIIWIDSSKDVHCTYDLDISTWQVSRS